MVTNRVARPVAAVVPGFAVVEHTGRRSGAHYRTPVNAFRHGDGYAVALTYGSASDWVSNVVAAGGCTLLRRARRVRVVRPRVVSGDDARAALPPLLRPLLRRLRVDAALLLDATSD